MANKTCRAEGRTKQPDYVHPIDPGDLFLLAGLWDRWETPKGALESCTLITTEANPLMAELHTRRPVILPGAGLEAWLNPRVEAPEALRGFLAPCDPTGMEAYRVGPVKGDGAERIAKVE